MREKKHAQELFALTLLGAAFTALVLTSPSHAETDRNSVYGPVQPVAVIQEPRPAPALIHELIREQLTAIRARDAEQAFALTTGALHEKYDTAGKFLSEMRFMYRPVYNHESYRFLEQVETDTGGLIQRVEVEYPHGDPTVVIYRLKRTADGEWAIDSFSLVEDDEGQDI